MIEAAVEAAAKEPEAAVEEAKAAAHRKTLTTLMAIRLGRDLTVVEEARLASLLESEGHDAMLRTAVLRSPDELVTWLSEG